MTANSQSISLQIPGKYSKYLSDTDYVQQIITEVLFDYIEAKQDEETAEHLKKSSRFADLNARMNQLTCTL